MHFRAVPLYLQLTFSYKKYDTALMITCHWVLAIYTVINKTFGMENIIYIDFIDFIGSIFENICFNHGFWNGHKSEVFLNIFTKLTWTFILLLFCWVSFIMQVEKSLKQSHITNSMTVSTAFCYINVSYILHKKSTLHTICFYLKTKWECWIS